jgi:uncharacterized membrane protein YdjX (TVP38/TMEM64 family)
VRGLLPVLIVVAVLAAAWRLHLADALSWPAIGGRLAGWRGFAAARPVMAALAYVGLYAGFVGLSLPAGGALTVLGGALFGALLGGALAVAGASLGAVLLFLVARSTLGRWLAAGAAPLVERLRPALQRDGFLGLLALRLIPVVPFWLTNLAPALLGMRLLPYAAATVRGIVPATFVLAGIGHGAQALLARGQAPDLSALLSPTVLLPLLGLAALSLTPVLWRRWRSRHA